MTKKVATFEQIWAKSGYFPPKLHVATKVAIFGNFGGDMAKINLETLAAFGAFGSFWQLQVKKQLIYAALKPAEFYKKTKKILSN